MKVIHFIANIDKSKGGTSEYMRLLGFALNKNINLIIACGYSDNPATIDGVRVEFFNTKITSWFSIRRAFKAFLKAERPDLVHINAIWNLENFLFQKVAHELGIKVILSIHGMLEPWIMARNPWKKALAMLLYQRKAIGQATLIHATAELEKQNIQKLGFTNPITVVPNGIDLTEIKRTKQAYGTKKMVFLSRIHPKKGIELLIQAWRQIDTKGWSLAIAGNGDVAYIDTLKQAAKDLPNVNFIGPQYGEAKWDCFRAADIMVLPTYSENFGIVVAEALAVGVPVITTKGSPWQDLTIHKCGWWIDLSVAQLQKTLTEAMNTSTANLEIMGKHGQNLIKSKYDIKAVADLFLKIYSKDNI